METGIKWDAVKEDMAKADWELVEDNLRKRLVYLGSCFNVMPSGKYYMPWACSNVTDEEAKADMEFQELLEKEADEHGFIVEAGEGDPCDIYIAEYEEVNS